MAITDAQMIENDERIAKQCPSCFGDIATHRGRTDYQELYLTILQIGQSRVNHGMRYSDLLSELSKRGFNIDNGCLQQAVKQWFYDAYFHITSGGNKCDLNEVDEHSACTFILKGESSLLLLEHDKISKTIALAKSAILVAIIVGALTIVISWYLAYHPIVNQETRSKNPQAISASKMQVSIFKQRN